MWHFYTYKIGCKGKKSDTIPVDAESYAMDNTLYERVGGSILQVFDQLRTPSLRQAYQQTGQKSPMVETIHVHQFLTI